MSMHLTLMGNASRGLPRQGLVAIYDPYRDVYGRNVLPVTAEEMTAGVGVWAYEACTMVAGVFRETAAENAYHRIGWGAPTYLPNGIRQHFQIEIKPDGRDYVYLLPVASNAAYGGVTINLTTGAMTSDINTTWITIHGYGAEVLSDGYVRCWLDCTGISTAQGINFGLRPKLDADTLRYTGDTSKGYLLRNPQLNIGPVLHAYSAPSGAPGTLQTCADRWGGLYPLQLGSGATADAADPVFTGVALLHAADYLISGNLSGVTMAGDWTLPFLCKPSGTSGVLVSLADASAADQYQAIEYNGSTKVRIKTVNGATVTTSDDLTVSATAVQMLSLVSSGNTITLKRMDTGTSVTATNADPTGAARLCIGALGTSTVASAADALTWHLLPLYGRAWTAQEAAKSYVYSKSLMARRGVTLA